MIILRDKRYAQILNTNVGPGFIKNRKYDMDLYRLGRMDTAQRELQKVGDLTKESRKLSSELHRGIEPQDLRD